MPLVDRGDVQTPNRPLDLEKRVGSVMRGSRSSLAIRAKVRIVTNDTLVANAFNVRLLRLRSACNAIAVDAVVFGAGSGAERDRLIERGEAVTRMGDSGLLDALAAVIEVGTIEALVTDTVDVRITAITGSVMTNVAAGIKERLFQSCQRSSRSGLLETVSRMMPVLVDSMARQAKVVIGTDFAGNESILW